MRRLLVQVDNKLIESIESVKKNLESDEDLRKIREEVARKLVDYRKTMSYMLCDAPIEVLGLPAVIENALLAHGCSRIYNILDLDLTEVKGLGAVRIGHLTTRLDEFFSMI
jgi:hypothetical protein